MRAAAFLLASLLANLVSAQPLSPEELSRLTRFQSERTLGSLPREWREKEAPRFEAVFAAARADFAGQGRRVADHYLRHTGTPPGAGAYFFVLEAVGGTDAAALLARALVDPPRPESGPEFDSGGRRHRLARHEGEIQAALEAVLGHEATARDPQAARALGEAIDTLRALPRGMGAGGAARAVSLLGRCASAEARELLARYAADTVAEIRAAALEALAAAGGKADAGLLARSLLEDPSPRARSEAARAIAHLKAGSELPTLRRALAAETHPEVVDAVVRAVAAFNALPQEPAACHALAGRTWELQAAWLAAACWRATAGREALIQAAQEGPPITRAIALIALFQRPATREQPLVRAVPRQAPPPPVGAARAVPSIAATPAPAAVPAPERFGADERHRLLASAVEVLSRPAVAFPRPGAISHSAAHPLNELLLEMAGSDMPLALSHADRIVTRGARSANDGRLAASQALARADGRAYAAARRLPQALLAGTLALGALLLGLLARSRGAAVAAALPLAAWAAWSLWTAAVRELPPLALAPFTVLGSASLTAALVAGIGAWRGGWLVGAAAIGAAGVAGFFFCGALRWFDVFPVGSEGWESIFEPVGAAVAAALLAAAGLIAAAAARYVEKK